MRSYITKRLQEYDLAYFVDDGIDLKEAFEIS